MLDERHEERKNVGKRDGETRLFHRALPGHTREGRPVVLVQNEKISAVSWGNSCVSGY